MSNLFASVFTGFGAFFAGIFGGGHASANNMPMMHPAPNSAWMASTTAPHGMMPMMRNGLIGVVASIDGTTIVVDGRQGTSTATTTYSVDASNAKVIKGPATTTASISSILVGDHVIVEGTVTGTSVTAKLIIDGRIPMMGGAFGGRGVGQPGNASSTRGYRGGVGGGWNASSTNGMPPRMPGMRGQYQGQGGANPGGPMIPAGDNQGGQGNMPQNMPGMNGDQNGGPGQQQ